MVEIDAEEESQQSRSSSGGSYVDFEEMDQEVFDALPDDIKYEIISERRARLKESKKNSLTEFPQTSDDFSEYQLKMLCQKGKLLNQIADIKKSIGSTYSGKTNF